MARKATSGGSAKSDKSYNVRRREYRAAQRYLKQASQSSGQAAEKNKALARVHLLNALDTYDPTAPMQKIAAGIVNAAAQLGLDVQAQRKELIATVAKDATPEQVSQAREKFVQRIDAMEQASIEATASARKDESTRRRLEAAELLGTNSPTAKRIMGGLVDIWRDVVDKGKSAKENREAAQKAIFDHFKVSSWVEVLEILENNIGDELYSITSDLETYDVVKIALQKGVRGNTLVQ